MGREKGDREGRSEKGRDEGRSMHVSGEGGGWVSIYPSLTL